jgi:hypothetical protein
MFPNTRQELLREGVIQCLEIVGPANFNQGYVLEYENSYLKIQYLERADLLWNSFAYSTSDSQSAADLFPIQHIHSRPKSHMSSSQAVE